MGNFNRDVFEIVHTRAADQKHILLSGDRGNEFFGGQGSLRCAFCAVVKLPIIRGRPGSGQMGSYTRDSWRVYPGLTMAVVQDSAPWLPRTCGRTKVCFEKFNRRRKLPVAGFFAAHFENAMTEWLTSKSMRFQPDAASNSGKI